jgi:hypothetical protein
MKTVLLHIDGPNLGTMSDYVVRDKRKVACRFFAFLGHFLHFPCLVS